MPSDSDFCLLTYLFGLGPTPSLVPGGFFLMGSQRLCGAGIDPKALEYEAYTQPPEQSPGPCREIVSTCILFFEIAGTIGAV